MKKNFQNLIFPEESMIEKDVSNFWSRDYEKIKNIPKIVTTKTFWYSIKFKNVKKKISEDPHEFAIKELLYELRSFTGRSLAEVIVEDFCKRFENDRRLYHIELSNSKYFFDNQNLIHQLKKASKDAKSKRECIDLLKEEFATKYAREFASLADYKKY